MASDREITLRVIRAREEAGMKKNELAEQLGLTPSGYSPYEHDLGSSFEGTFSVQQLLQLSRILGRPVEYFLGLDSPLSEEEAEILHLWRQIDNDVVKRLVRNALRDGAGVPRE